MIESLFENRRRKIKQEPIKNIESFDKIPSKLQHQKTILKLLQRIQDQKGSNKKQLNQICQKKTQLQRFIRFNPNISLQVTSESTNTILASTTDSLFRHTLKSNYDDLINKYANTNQQFTDPNFPPNNISLGENLSKRSNIGWKRISQIIKNPVFIKDIVQPEDILQGAIGDCYFMSAIASIAQYDFRIKSLFGSLQIQPNGIYMAQFLSNGVLQEVVVDDYIPIQYNSPIFASPKGGNQIWVMILEKCWAKINGSYDKIDKGGLPHQVLHDFTCAPTFYNIIPCDKNGQQLLFKKMIEADKSGAILCCGTSQDSSIDQQGLLHAHAYSLLEVYQNPFRMVKVRNPFGNVQWKGRANQQDIQFWNSITAQDKNRLGFVVKNDGVFFMLWQDFIKAFIMVDFCMVEDNANYLFIQSNFKYQEPKLFQFQILQNFSKLTITLSQDSLQNLSQKQKKKGLSKTVLIVSKNEKQNGYKTYSFLKSSQYSWLPDHYVVLQNLQKGKYTIYVQCNWHTECYKKATLSFYGQGKMKIQERQTKDVQQFIHLTALNHSIRNQKKKKYISQDLTAWKSSQLLIGTGDLGYFVFYVQKSAKFKLGVQLDQKLFLQKQITVLGPYKGKGYIKLIVNPGQYVIILVKFNPYNLSQSLSNKNIITAFTQLNHPPCRLDVPEPKATKLT